MWIWTPHADFLTWQATWGRWLRSIVIAAFLTVAPATVAWLTAPPGSLVQVAAVWYFVVVFAVGIIGGSMLYVGLRGLAHRQLHRRLQSPLTGQLERGCPWCDEELEFHALPAAVREERDRLRERLRRAEFVD